MVKTTANSTKKVSSSLLKIADIDESQTLLSIRMSTFEYKGFDASGKAFSGLIEALDAKQAREKLAVNGILTERVLPVGEAKKWWKFSETTTMSLSKRMRFYQELLSFIRAGIPLVTAIDTIIQSPEGSQMYRQLADIRDKLKEGSSLANALFADSKNISNYEKAVIAAGEKTGMLPHVLEQLSDFLDEKSRLRERIITASIYPMIIIITAIAIAIGLLGFAVPRFCQVLQEEIHINLPLLTRIMIKLGQFVAHWGIACIIILSAASWLVWRNIRRVPDRIQALDRQLLQLPGIGRGYSLLVNLHFARTLSLLLAGGIPLIDGMKLAGEATGSVWVSRKVKNEADAVKHGSSLTDALRRIPPFASSLAGWVKIGEASGTLSQMLESAGKRFQQHLDQYLSRFMAIFEPVVFLVIGVFVLLIVLSIILPILALNRQLM